MRRLRLSFLGATKHLSNLESDKITLIELSPFLPCTGPALFKWGIDRQRFEQGPFEFRLQTTLHPHIDELLEVNWDDRWNNPVARYDTFYSLATTPEIDPQLAQQRAKLLTMGAYATAASCALAIVAIATAQHQPVAATLAGASSLASLVYSSRCRRQLEEANSLPPKTHLLFCYGTLKRNFHWNKKFLGQVHCSFPCNFIEVLLLRQSLLLQQPLTTQCLSWWAIRVCPISSATCRLVKASVFAESYGDSMMSHCLV